MATIAGFINSVIAVFTGATSSTNGTSGLVPAPLAGQQDYYLQGNGQWTSVSGSTSYYQTIESSGSALTQRPTFNFTGSGVTVTDNSGSNRTDVTISGGGGLSYVNVSGTTQAMAVNTIYGANNSSLVTLTLPTTAAAGTIISVAGINSGGWSVAQNAGQNIQIGNVSTTAGTGGSVSSSNRYDSIQLICVTANTTWTSLGSPCGLLTLI
jgi:hypothetical protein